MSKERLIAMSIMIVATLIGSVSMLLFIVFLFTGSFGLVPMGLPPTAVLAWSACLSFVFFISTVA
jgi:hypothetical protein